MIKPSNACAILLFLELLISIVVFIGMETCAFSPAISVFAGFMILAFLFGLCYVREFAKKAEDKLGWK